MKTASSDFQGSCPIRPNKVQVTQMIIVKITGWFVINSAVFSCRKKCPGLSIAVYKIEVALN